MKMNSIYLLAVILLMLGTMVMEVSGAPACCYYEPSCSAYGEPCGIFKLASCCSGSCDDMFSGTCGL
uniref:Uncharacterized protein n=1 Tax=Chenopodium quinoa TaxID=63459 RepID=A0A803LZL9_CHEQI